MKLTVFIPTYNGKAKLKQLLARLELQSDPDFTVHVLIDGSTDDSYALKDEFPKCHFHSYPNAGRAAIRNRALEICKQGIVLFLDHDMLPESDLIAKHKSFHLTNSGSVLVGNGFRNPERAVTDFARYLVAAEQNWISTHQIHFTVSQSDFVFTACNLSMPVEVFAQMNGFNSELRDGEDFEFGMRALASGVTVYYDRKVLAWHEDWPTLSSYIQRNSEYLAGKKALVKLNPAYEQYLKVGSGEKSHNKFKQFLQAILGRAAMNNTLLFRMLPLNLRFVAFRSAIYQFSKA
jgi:glycosyltransferase involved in cell wall biosynthesis